MAPGAVGVITRNLSRFRSRSYPSTPYPELTFFSHCAFARQRGRSVIRGTGQRFAGALLLRLSDAVTAVVEEQLLHFRKSG